MWPVHSGVHKKTKEINPRFYFCLLEIILWNLWNLLFWKHFFMCDVFWTFGQILFILFSPTSSLEKAQKVFSRQDGMLIMKLGHSKTKFWKVNLNFELLCDPKKCGHVNQLRFCPVYSFSLLNYLYFFSWCRILDEVNQIQTYAQIAGIHLE